MQKKILRVSQGIGTMSGLLGYKSKKKNTDSLHTTLQVTNLVAFPYKAKVPKCFSLKAQIALANSAAISVQLTEKSFKKKGWTTV